MKVNEINDLLDKQAWGDDFNGLRDRLIIMMFYETGVRLAELVGMDDEAVNLAGQFIKVTGKGDKQRVIPFGNELKSMIENYVEERNRTVSRKTEALLVSETGLRIKPDLVQRIVKENLARFCSLKKKSPHVLRHTFATAMLNHGADIESLKQLLGHSRLSTTEIYTHTTFAQLKRVYTEAHPRA